MTNIFLSYRREDSLHKTGRIYDRLYNHFTSTQVFKDVDSIPIGSDFRKVLTERLATCEVFLAIIGDGWLSVADAKGNRRLDNQGDYIRIEIEAALSRRILVIPVLVGSAPVPRAEELPESLSELSFRHGISVRDDPAFHNDVDRLIRGIEAGIEEQRARSNSEKLKTPKSEDRKLSRRIGELAEAEPESPLHPQDQTKTDALLAVSQDQGTGDHGNRRRSSRKLFLTISGWGFKLTLAIAGSAGLLLAIVSYQNRGVLDQPHFFQKRVEPEPPLIAKEDLPTKIASPTESRKDDDSPVDRPKAVVETLPKPSQLEKPLTTTDESLTAEIRRLPGIQGSVKSVSISADGRFAIACDDTAVHDYNVETGEELRVNRLNLGGDKFVRTVALSPRGGRALLGGSNPEVVLWDYQGRKEVTKLLHGKSVFDLSFTPDGLYAVTASQERLLRVWSTETRQEVMRFTIEESDTSFSLNEGARLGVNGNTSGYAELWDGKSGKPIRRFLGHQGSVSGVSLSGDGRRLLTGGEDGTVRFWNAENGQELRRFKGHQGRVNSVSISADGKLGISGGGRRHLEGLEIGVMRDNFQPDRAAHQPPGTLFSCKIRLVAPTTGINGPIPQSLRAGR